MTSPKPTGARSSGLSLRAGLVEARGLLGMALPIIVGLSTTTAVVIVDTLMLAPLGKEALAAAALTATTTMVVHSALFGLVTIVGIRMAHGHGACDAQAVQCSLLAGRRVALQAAVGLAAFMAGVHVLLPSLGQPVEVVAYARGYWMLMAAAALPLALFHVEKSAADGIGQPWRGVAFAAVVLGANVPLNAMLIHGVGAWPGLGLPGAGAASAAAYGIGALFFRGFGNAVLAPGGDPPSHEALRAETGRQWRQGIPLAIGTAGEGGSFAVGALMVGWFGVTALAASQIVHAVMGMIYMVPLGIGLGASMRIGQAVGAGQSRRARPIAAVGLVVVFLWMILVTSVLASGGEWVAGFFSDDAEVVLLAGQLLLAIAAMQVVDGVQSVGLGALRGLLDTRIPTLIAQFSYWGIALPAGYLLALPLGLGPAGIWYGFCIGLSVAAILLPLRFVRRTR